MPFSTAYANNILSYVFGKTKTLTAPTKIYLGLSSNDPEADNGAFTELVGGGYTRVLVSNQDDAYPNLMGTASERSITNTAQINWTKATADWSEAKGLGLFTTPSGGTPIYYGTLDTPVKVVAGAVALFDPGALRVSIATTDENA